jgi:hypothetical protein
MACLVQLLVWHAQLFINIISDENYYSFAYLYVFWNVSIRLYACHFACSKSARPYMTQMFVFKYKLIEPSDLLGVDRVGKHCEWHTEWHTLDLYCWVLHRFVGEDLRTGSDGRSRGDGGEEVLCWHRWGFPSLQHDPLGRLGFVE